MEYTIYNFQLNSFYHPFQYAFVIFLFHILPYYSVKIFHFHLFRDISQEYLSDFCCEDKESIEKLEDLRERVRKSGLEQYE